MKKFYSLSIRSNVAEEFKVFAKKYNVEYSDVLSEMMSFIQDNEVQLFQKENEFLSLRNLVNKRFNALVAIIKSIEKTQTKPTANLTAILFEQLAKEVTDLPAETRNSDKPKMVLKSKVQ